VRRVLMSVAHAELPESVVVVDRERIRKQRRFLEEVVIR
jgi:hypothetical protein